MGEHKTTTLIRTGVGSTDPSERKRWLLIKHRDQHADPSWDIESPELDHSVLSVAAQDRHQECMDGTERRGILRDRH